MSGPPPSEPPAELLAALDKRLAHTDAKLSARYGGPAPGRQPIHTAYVPADRFTGVTASQWGVVAAQALATHGANNAELAQVLGLPPALLDQVKPSVVHKLHREPVEDLRIDFEDGYGRRPDAEEDAAAIGCAQALARSWAAGGGVPFAGLRCKSLEADTRHRAVRTVFAFYAAFVAAGGDPARVVVTYPKVSVPDQVEAITMLCAELEGSLGVPAGTLRFELQVETPAAVVGPAGAASVARMITAAGGRCRGLHFGTYDYTAACEIAPDEQRTDHPAAEYAKAVMQAAAAGTGVHVSDGSSNVLPIGDHDAVLAAWRLQAGLVRRALRAGFYQGWDLHPAQLPCRFLVVHAFFRQGYPAALARLRGYRERAASGVLDEPATERALVGFLRRGVECGALAEAELADVFGAAAPV